MKNKSLVIFFRYMVIGFIISSLKNNIVGLPVLIVVQNMFLSFIYNVFIGIWVGMAALFGHELYYYLKKNLRNESQISGPAFIHHSGSRYFAIK